MNINKNGCLEVIIYIAAGLSQKGIPTSVFKKK